MKKKYTKKQIQEAIKYWENQLKLGNYKKLLKEGISTDSALECAEVIDNSARSSDNLLEWFDELDDEMAKELSNLGDYDTNLEYVDKLIKEIEWEHGDIGEEADQWKNYLIGLSNAYGDQAKAERWLNSSVNDDEYYSDDDDYDDDVED